MLTKILLVSFITFACNLLAQEFRIERPVPNNVQTNGSYLYGEPSVSNPGYAHNGTDILVKWDTVYSATDGVVSFVGYSAADTGQYGGYEPMGAGNYIFTKSFWNNSYYYFLYGHLTRPFVTSNQTVTAGQPIALSGNTGYSTGAHLHFEIRKGSQSSATRNKRNSELWCGITGMGAICGRVPNAPNNTRVDISPDPKPRPPYSTYSYSLTYLFTDSNIGSDDFYNENYAIGDVKPGTYTIRALNNTYVRNVTVLAGQVVNADPPTGITENPVEVNNFNLSQNFPNPFNPSTVIRFEIPERSFVQLKIYDLLGRLIATLVDEERLEGIYNELFFANNLTSGVYIYTIIAQSYEGKNIFRESKKMMLIK
jgi:murein DD-endopeptidase MepM/ murein hydrolase activator NlpD